MPSPPPDPDPARSGSAPARPRRRKRARTQRAIPPTRNPLRRWHLRNWRELGGGWEAAATWSVMAAVALWYVGTPGGRYGSDRAGVPELVMAMPVAGAAIVVAGLFGLVRHGRRWPGGSLIAFGLAVVAYGLSGAGAEPLRRAARATHLGRVRERRDQRPHPPPRAPRNFSRQIGFSPP